MKFLLGNLNFDSCSPHPTPHKHLYLWSDHHVKGVRYEVHSWKHEPRLLFPTLHKRLYLWSDHRVKGARYYSKSYR